MYQAVDVFGARPGCSVLRNMASSWRCCAIIRWRKASFYHFTPRLYASVVYML